MTLVAALLIASLVAWTGLWGRLLTWGEWGRLTVADLLGFLMVAGALLALGLFIVLFTVRAALRQVELALRVADRKVDRHLAALSLQVEESEARTMARLADERKAYAHHRQSLADQVRIEAAQHLDASRQEAVQATRTTFRGCAEELKRTLAVIHPTRADADRLRAALDGMRRQLDEMRAEAAVFEEAMDERTRAAADALAHDTEELHASLIRARAEILRSMETEVHKVLVGRAPKRETAVPRAERVRGWLGNGGR